VLLPRSLKSRLELERALGTYRKHKAKLVIDKLDHLSRNSAFIAALNARLGPMRFATPSSQGLPHG